MLAPELPSYIGWRWAWLTIAAFLGGVLNAVAGGGSFLLFPAILGMKVLPVQANATNTVALWPGQLTSVAAYWEDVRRNLRVAIPMAVAGLIGGTCGAIVLLNTPQMTFLRLVPWLLLVAAVIFALSGPVSKWLERLKVVRSHAPGGVHRPRMVPVFLGTVALCFYIGYFGAGAGFLIITLLSLFGYQDLNEINALKVVSTTMANGIAFVLCDQRAGGVALLSGGDGDVRGGWIYVGEPGATDSAAGAAGDGGVHRAGDGDLVFLAESVRLENLRLSHEEDYGEDT